METVTSRRTLGVTLVFNFFAFKLNEVKMLSFENMSRGLNTCCLLTQLAHRVVFCHVPQTGGNKLFTDGHHYLETFIKRHISGLKTCSKVLTIQNK